MFFFLNTDYAFYIVQSLLQSIIPKWFGTFRFQAMSALAIVKLKNRMDYFLITIGIIYIDCGKI
jgi:hypothetical protein